MVKVRDAIEQVDLARIDELLAPDVVWVGTGPRMLCRNRDQVRGMFQRAFAGGRSWAPEIVFDEDDVLVVDPHGDPPPDLNPELHQVFVLEDGLISEVRDYPDREAALGAVRRR